MGQHSFCMLPRRFSIASFSVYWMNNTKNAASFLLSSPLEAGSESDRQVQEEPFLQRPFSQLAKPMTVSLCLSLPSVGKSNGKISQEDISQEDIMRGTGRHHSGHPGLSFRRRIIGGRIGIHHLRVQSTDTWTKRSWFSITYSFTYLIISYQIIKKSQFTCDVTYNIGLAAHSKCFTPFFAFPPYMSGLY